MKTITLEVELLELEAYALAELCKRIGFNDARALAAHKEEAYRMIYATNKVRDALANKGVVVR